MVRDDLDQAQDDDRRSMAPEGAIIDRAQFRNRAKITWRSKLWQVRIFIRENGIAWTSCFLAYYTSQVIADKLNSWLERERISRNLPGINSVESQRAIWDAWNWQQQGEEWTASPVWKKSIIENFISRFIPNGSRVVEIGPGAGRWTEYLIPLSSALHLVDLSQACIDECKVRFGDDPRVEFHINNGSDLAFIVDASIDRIWSFDCFVHIDSPDVRKYVHECARVLTGGGIAIIHHGSTGKMRGWRSRLTRDQMQDFIRAAGMVVLECVDSWEMDGEKFEAGYGDSVTVFQKPK
jgi:SAM-dependent methyltransferase